MLVPSPRFYVCLCATWLPCKWTKYFTHPGVPTEERGETEESIEEAPEKRTEQDAVQQDADQQTVTRGEFQKELKKLSNLFKFELGSLRRDLANIKKEVEKKKKKEGKQFGVFKESPFWGDIT